MYPLDSISSISISIGRHAMSLLLLQKRFVADVREIHGGQTQAQRHITA